MNSPDPRDQQYRTADPPVAGTVPPVVQPQGGGVPQGVYQVPRPTGMPPVQVVAPPMPVPPAVAPPPPMLDADVVRLATSVQGELVEIRGWLQRLGLGPLVGELGVVAGTAEKLVNLAAQRADRSALAAQFALYKLTWQRVSTRLKALPQADPWLVGHVDAVERSTALLQELLLVGPGGVYDRAKVGALTVQLADVTGQVLRVVRVAAPGAPGGPDLYASAQRVKALADGLAEAVQQDIAFTVVVEQYGQFADAWGRLMGWLKPPSPLAPQVRPLVLEVCRIDAALTRGLLVEPPGCSIQQRRLGLAASITREGDALVASLLAQLLASADPVQAAEDFARSAEGLRLWIEAHPVPTINIGRPEVVAVTSAWRRLANQMERLDRARFPEAFLIAERIRGEVDLLLRVLQD